MGEKDFETPNLKMDIAGRPDYRQEPLSLLSLIDTPNILQTSRPLKQESPDTVLLSKQPAMALPTHEEKLSTPWTASSLKNFYEDGLFKIVSNSSGEKHLGFKFLQPPGQSDQRHTALGPQRKDKFEDRLGISLNVQMKF